MVSSAFASYRLKRHSLTRKTFHFILTHEDQVEFAAQGDDPGPTHTKREKLMDFATYNRRY